MAQFDESAASEAQIAAATAVVEAIKAIDTQVYLGNAVPASGGAPPAFDPTTPRCSCTCRLTRAVRRTVC